MGLPHPCLMLVTEPCANLSAIVEKAVAGGVNVVLWHDTRAKIGRRDPALTGVAAATEERALLVAGGTWETLVRLGLRRIHLLERSAPVGVVKFRIGNGALVGKSVESEEAAVQAEASGADYVIVERLLSAKGASDAGARKLDDLRGICATVHISVVASGGITPQNTSACIHEGASGIAVSSPILQAVDPRAVAEEYWAALQEAWENRKHG